MRCASVLFYAKLSLLAVLIAILLVPAARAQFAGEKVLYSFAGGTDGSVPYSGITFDAAGNLYGTTYNGGAYGYGTVFKLTPTASGPYTETILYSFQGPDGASPHAGVTLDAAGNLYGTTYQGGVHGSGIVFKLTPTGSGPWTETVLYSFTGGADGAGPYAGVILDPSGNLFGTTVYGGNQGSANNCGVVFELVPASGTPWTELVLHTFLGLSGSPIDGCNPYAGLVVDQTGILYGTTYQGGGGGCGQIFSLNKSSGSYGSLWDFGGAAGNPCLPYSGVVIGPDGLLYGTTSEGQGGNGNGTDGCSTSLPGCGAVYQLLPEDLNTIHWFYEENGDGAGPMTGVTFNSAGNLYGAALNAIYELTGGSWNESIVYDFSGGSDGSSSSESPLSFDASGNLYGTSDGGGIANCSNGIATIGCGLVFEFPRSTSLVATATSVSSSSNPTTFGQVVAFTATVSPSGSPAPTGSVSFTSNGSVICATQALSASGTATCSAAFSPAGAYSVWANYSGDSKYAASAGGLTQVVTGGASSVTTLSSTANPSDQFQVVTFTATVGPLVGSVEPTGTMAFYADGNAIPGCSLQPVYGTATCQISTLPLGVNNIVAYYSGDGDYNGSASAAFSQVVIPIVGTASTTSAVSSNNPSTSGQSVTISATVLPTGPPAPTGTVAYLVNSVAISGCASVALVSGAATCTTSALGVGTDTIVAIYSGDSNYSGSYAQLSQVVMPIATAAQFVPIAPCRVVDTRKATAPFGGPAISGGSYRSFTVPAGPCAGIPGTAVAYALNVTAVPSGALGYLTIWPTGEVQPLASTLNSLDGRIKANATIVPAGTSGAVSVYASNTTNVVLDISGYFEAGGSTTLQFYPLSPCRVADTRKADGLLGGPSLIAATERDFPIVSSVCSIPGTAQAYSLNFTAIPPGGGTLAYLTVWPQGETRPLVSTLNDLTGTIVANAAIVPAGASGGVAVYPSDATDLVIDVNGYFATPQSNGLSLYSLAPCRVIDTRKTSGAFDGELLVGVDTSSCGSLSGAQAYVFNATVVPVGALGYLTLWPYPESTPLVSTLNALDGAITSNMAIVPNNNGEIDAYASGTTQLVLDISAYFAP